MEAYEFYATPENGTIKIPEQYRTLIKSVVKVILLEQEPSNEATQKAVPPRKSDLLLAPSMRTNGWKFNREEANAR